uniref:DRBM domain-containing protein n=1 Tax=Trichuris muris TaxID=70415 RepID=A0A5S6Q913_TRIMR
MRIVLSVYGMQLLRIGGMTPPRAVESNLVRRNVSAESVQRNPAPIGGPGLTVDVDRSLFMMRKYNCSRSYSQQWVFGGICRVTGECFHSLGPQSPCDLLNFQCRQRGYVPEFEYEVTDISVPVHTCRLTLEGVVISGQAKTKKVSKHVAVAQFLRSRVLLGEQNDWGLPPDPTKALKMIENLLMPFRNRLLQ